METLELERLTNDQSIILSLMWYMPPSQSARIDDLMRYDTSAPSATVYLGCHLPKYSLESRGPQGAFPNPTFIHIGRQFRVGRWGNNFDFTAFWIPRQTALAGGIITWYCGCVGASVFQGRTSLFQTHQGGRVQKLSQSCAAA